MATEAQRMNDKGNKDGGFYVPPFTIIVDTAEQLPWSFAGMYDDRRKKKIVVQTIRQYIPTGDYSIVGMDKMITIERKSIEDAYRSFTANRDRFKKELERMRAFVYAAIIIEGDWADIITERPAWTNKPPSTIIRSLLSWSARYGVHVFPIHERRNAEKVAYRLLKTFYYEHQKESQSNG